MSFVSLPMKLIVKKLVCELFILTCKKCSLYILCLKEKKCSIFSDIVLEDISIIILVFIIVIVVKRDSHT